MVEQAIEHPRRATEDAKALLEIDVHAAKGDPRQGNVLVVGPQGRVQRGQKDVAARRAEGRGQRVAVQATAAIHRAGAGGEVNDLHGFQRKKDVARDCNGIVARVHSNWSLANCRCRSPLPPGEG